MSTLALQTSLPHSLSTTSLNILNLAINKTINFEKALKIENCMDFRLENQALSACREASNYDKLAEKNKEKCLQLTIFRFIRIFAERIQFFCHILFDIKVSHD